MKKRTTILLSLTMALALSFSGCGQNVIGSETADHTYNMNSALDAGQYCNFINKQINAVINQLSSNMLMGNSVARGDCSINDAIATAKQSISIIESALNEVDIMIPPNQYQDTRAHTLQLMKKSKSDIQVYIDELSKSSPDKEKIYKLCSEMNSDFTALSSEFNVYYE